MRSWPTSVGELDDNVRWAIDSYLKTIEEFARDPSAFGTAGLSTEEVNGRIGLAVERMNKQAEEEAILDGMRVQTRELWQDFPELELLGNHFRRAALRKAGRGFPGTTDPPSQEEGLRLARAVVARLPGRSLMARIPGADWFNLEWESEFISMHMAYHLLLNRSSPLLRKCVKHSGIRVHFNAPRFLCEEMERRGESIPGPLKKWHSDTDGGRLGRPPMKPMPKHRPVTMPKFLSDVNIQLTIEILRRIGIQPEGRPVGGCHIVSEALATSEDKALRLSEETIRRVWQERPWERPFVPVMVKNSKAIAERNRLTHNDRG